MLVWVDAMTTKKLERCGGCKYYVDIGRFSGRCRRNAPTIDPRDGRGIHPSVNFGGWCGEFEQLQLEDDEHAGRD